MPQQDIDRGAKRQQTKVHTQLLEEALRRGAGLQTSKIDVSMGEQLRVVQREFALENSRASRVRAKGPS